jgi:hypothetical protein
MKLKRKNPHVTVYGGFETVSKPDYDWQGCRRVPSMGIIEGTRKRGALTIS